MKNEYTNKLDFILKGNTKIKNTNKKKNLF